MMSGSINQILEAEKHAEEKLIAAGKEAEHIIENAKAKAKDLLASATVEAESEQKMIKQKNQLLVEQIVSKSEDRCREKIDSVRNKAEVKAAQMVELVIAELKNS